MSTACVFTFPIIFAENSLIKDLTPLSTNADTKKMANKIHIKPIVDSSSGNVKKMKNAGSPDSFDTMHVKINGVISGLIVRNADKKNKDIKENLSFALEIFQIRLNALKIPYFFIKPVYQKNILFVNNSIEHTDINKDVFFHHKQNFSCTKKQKT